VGTKHKSSFFKLTRIENKKWFEDYENFSVRFVLQVSLDFKQSISLNFVGNDMESVKGCNNTDTQNPKCRRLLFIFRQFYFKTLFMLYEIRKICNSSIYEYDRRYMRNRENNEDIHTIEIVGQ
jgi:hypothetical protein